MDGRGAIASTGGGGGGGGDGDDAGTASLTRFLTHVLLLRSPNNFFSFLLF